MSHSVKFHGKVLLGWFEFVNRQQVLLFFGIDTTLMFLHLVGREHRGKRLSPFIRNHDKCIVVFLIGHKVVKPTTSSWKIHPERSLVVRRSFDEFAILRFREIGMFDVICQFNPCFFPRVIVFYPKLMCSNICSLVYRRQLQLALSISWCFYSHTFRSK